MVDSETGERYPHLMVVEDDPSLGRWIADYLGANGFVVTIATRGDEALELLRRDVPDLTVLDLGLPGLDGLEVCRRARRFYTRPILMLTARDEDVDEVSGLDHGADDYLCKPVRPKILLARVRALLRRGGLDRLTEPLRVGALALDLRSRTVTLAGEPIELSTNEFEVLRLLAASAGEPLSRETLVGRLRGIEYDGFDRSVDVCVSRLRRKLGDGGGGSRRIKTLRGIGYMLAPDAW